MPGTRAVNGQIHQFWHLKRPYSFRFIGKAHNYSLRYQRKPRGNPKTTLPGVRGLTPAAGAEVCVCGGGCLTASPASHKGKGAKRHKSWREENGGGGRAGERLSPGSAATAFPTPPAENRGRHRRARSTGRPRATPRGQGPPPPHRREAAATPPLRPRRRHGRCTAAPRPQSPAEPSRAYPTRGRCCRPPAAGSFLLPAWPVPCRAERPGAAADRRPAAGAARRHRSARAPPRRAAEEEEEKEKEEVVGAPRRLRAASVRAAETCQGNRHPRARPPAAPRASPPRGWGDGGGSSAGPQPTGERRAALSTGAAHLSPRRPLPAPGASEAAARRRPEAFRVARHGQSGPRAGPGPGPGGGAPVLRCSAVGGLPAWNTRRYFWGWTANLKKSGIWKRTGKFRVASLKKERMYFFLFAFQFPDPEVRFHFQQPYIFQSLVIYVNAYFQLQVYFCGDHLTCSGNPVALDFIQNWIAANICLVQVLIYLYNCSS